jgi:hypothetical protein
MTTEENKDWTPEKFPKPRTFPNGWDFSGLMAPNEKVAAQEDVDDWKPETFPKPRTIPENWHVEDKN